MQIIEQINRRIARGDLQPGDKLPSVREAALEFSVNPNTVQRAFHELEREGITETRRGHGSFVKEDSTLVVRLRNQLAHEAIGRCVAELKFLRMDLDLALELFQKAYRQSSHTRKESTDDGAPNRESSQ